ncbi:MAG: hypothetical protein JW704_10645 [Anaerolineaceae bacterium]|nr:hypothetical protein [Anaerolineaceae bacterium]
MFGPGGYISYNSNHRPFSAWVFIVTTYFLGESPLGYHILALLMRWAGAVAVWWTLKQLWPAADKQRLWVSLLFAIYPGFRELPIATVFNIHLVCLLLTLLSFGGMLWAVRHPHRFWPVTILSLIAGAVSIFTMEYFISLELLRPLFLFIVFQEKISEKGKRLLQTLLVSLPYMAILVVYGAWRIFFFKFPYYVPVLIDQSQSLGDRLSALLPLISTSILRAGFFAWFNPFIPNDFNMLGRNMLILSWAVLIAGTGATLAFLYRRKNEIKQAQPVTRVTHSSWPTQAISVGALALFIAGWPFWIAGLQVDLDPLGSRFTLPFIFGSALLVTGFIDCIPRYNTVKLIIIALLVGFSCSWHLQTTNRFRYEWEIIKDIYWQLTWRAPDLKPGTALLSNDIPLRYYSDNSLTALVNWVYAPENKSLDMPYLLDYISVRLGSGLTGLTEGLPINQDYSTLSFNGTTDNSIALFAVPPSCIRLLDRKLDDNYQRLPALSAKAARFSNLEQIRFDNQAVPPYHVFGQEPAPTWCYYFEKADLARQKKDWSAIVAYGDLAFTLNDNPNEATERLPFIEGYAHLCHWDRAVELSRDTVSHGGEGVITMLCNAWSRIAKTTAASPEQIQALQSIESDYNCTNQ